MGYVALTCLMATIELEFLQPIPRVYLHAPIKSFLENLSSLQAFLSEKSFQDGAAMKCFEGRIREFALEVEDDIEIQLSNFLLAKGDIVRQEAASQELCQTFQKAQEKAEQLVEIIPYLNKSLKSNNSLNENLSLQAFLSKKSFHGGAAMKSIEATIKEFALKVEDDIEIQLSNFVLAKDDIVRQEATSQELCQAFQKAEEKTEQLVEIIMYKEKDEGMRRERQNAFEYCGDLIALLLRLNNKYLPPNNSLIEKLSSLRELLVDTTDFDATEINDLETKIREFALQVEDDIKIQLSNILLSKDTVHQEEASQELFQTLQQAEEKTENLVEIIMLEKEEGMRRERQKSREYCDDLVALIGSMLYDESYEKFGYRTSLESLSQNLYTLQKILLTSNFGGAPIKDLKTKMREFVLKAKHDIEQQFHNLCESHKKLQKFFFVGKNRRREETEKAAQQLCQTLHQATEKAAQLLNTTAINNTSDEADDDDDTQSVSSDGSSGCSPNHEGLMVGRQNDVSMIKNQLFGRFHGVKVIPIIGMPGIGKTTLARKIFEDQSVASHFEVRKWFDVAHIYNGNKKLPRRDERRYLIVLDGIWSTQHWDHFQELLPNFENNGSCILLTTRFFGVAEYACTIKGTYYHFMNLLDQNESWNLFCTIRPLKKYRAPRFENFRSHLAQVVEKCEGLPLTIVVVSKRLSECKNDIQHELKKIEKEIELLGIIDNSALTLMYNQLPECLKGCFLYLGVFPKRSEIRVKTLVRLWIAEGFVKPSKNMESEETAYIYLSNLIARSLVLISRRTSGGEIKTCRVHSVMHNICFREAQKEGILCAVNTQQLPRWSLNALFANSCRWLSLCQHGFDYYVLFSLNNPRSIFFFQENPEIFVPLKLLRVLAFVPSPVLQRVHLGDLVFLRYLSVSQWFEGLSDVLSTNQNLQTLVISGGESEPQLHLPSTIWDSPHLKHLELGTSYTVDSPSGVKENLQTLSWVDPTHCRKKVYFSFPNLKRLKIFCKEDLDPGHTAGPSNKHIILGKLDYVEWLNSLTISVSVGCIVTFPEQCMFPLQLKKLKLSGTNLFERDLTVIGMLKWLEVLKLENAFHGKVWEVVEGGFYRLRFLIIKDKKLEQLKAYIDSFYENTIFGENIIIHC